ncbi:MAG: hypothetical protein Udaeo2_25570 [Candidatus Udaeobacter sp.]|nr:MAG: hypothetical protein Udaeo2_25570 [Candidatus Udaeobacter sp.]
MDDDGKAVGVKRTSKAAAIQLDVTFNKPPDAGTFHSNAFSRCGRCAADLCAARRLERARAGRCSSGATRGHHRDWHTNLVPNYYLVDDFQVRTPTDILGQHIHLVKFDVTSSDGAGMASTTKTDVQSAGSSGHDKGDQCGWRSPHRWRKNPSGAEAPPSDILACSSNRRSTMSALPDNWTPTSRPQCPSWLGAQTTVQRWYLDPLLDNSNVDRTLRTVYHDHFGPSTHQQAGLCRSVG